MGGGFILTVLQLLGMGGGEAVAAGGLGLIGPGLVDGNPLVSRCRLVE